MGIMKKSINSVVISLAVAASVSVLLSYSFIIQDQNNGAPLPSNVEKFVSSSCKPCHTAKGGLMARSKLNFDDWTGLSSEKQKAKAAAMYKMIKKDAMPPKTARENNPAIIPTDEQKEMIKTWSESLNSGSGSR
jgi:hypothetical protein